MIMGVNTDVAYAEAVFHVQTEDLGDHEAVIQSILFLRGETLETFRKPYDVSLRAAPEQLRERLVTQHRTVIRAILAGRFDASMQRMGSVAEEIRLVASELDEPRAGERASFLLLLRAEPSGRPIAGSTVRASLEASGTAMELYRGQTDGRGFRLVELQLPGEIDPGASLVFRAGGPHGEAEARFPVLSAGVARPQGEAERPNLIVSELEEPRAGESASLMLLLRTGTSARPIAAAAVHVLILCGDTSRELHRGSTDARGFHLAEFDVPDLPGECSVLAQAVSPLGTSEVLLPVLPS